MCGYSRDARTASKKQISPLRDDETVAPVEMTSLYPPHRHGMTNQSGLTTTVISTERAARAEKSAFALRRGCLLSPQRKSRRQSRLKRDGLSRNRMVKSQKLRVQKISPIARKSGEILQRLACKAVQRIAHEGMADRRQMDPDLMRAARTQAHLKGRGARGA